VAVPSADAGAAGRPAGRGTGIGALPKGPRKFLACEDGEQAATLASVIAALAEPAEERIERVRGWLCADPPAAAAAVRALDAADAGPSAKCALPLGALLSSINQREGELPGLFAGCPKSEEMDALALDELRDARIERREDRARETMRKLRGQPLDKPRWEELARAFAELNYADECRQIEPGCTPPDDYAIGKARAQGSAVDGEGPPPPEVKERALALFKDLSAEARAKVEVQALHGSLRPGEPGWLVSAAGLVRSGLSRRQWNGVAFLTAQRADIVEPFESRKVIKSPEGSAVGYALHDLVDIDGDGTSEIVLDVSRWENTYLAVYSIVDGRGVRRWAGGGTGL